MVLILIVFGHAMQLAVKFTKTHFGHCSPWSPFSASSEILLAVLLLIFFRSSPASSPTRTRDALVRTLFPQYQMMKSMAEGLARVESAGSVQPALSIEDGWQMAYLLEPLENGWVTVFLPQAPTPMSGNVMYLPADRVRPFEDITMVQAMAMRGERIGVGSAEALRGADLQASRGARRVSHPPFRTK